MNLAFCLKGPYGTSYDHYDSRGSIGRRSAGSLKNTQLGDSPEPPPPPPPPRNHETSNSSFNDSKESNEISEAECDRDGAGPRGNYGGESKSVPVSPGPNKPQQPQNPQQPPVPGQETQPTILWQCQV